MLMVQLSVVCPAVFRNIDALVAVGRDFDSFVTTADYGRLSRNDLLLLRIQRSYFLRCLQQEI